MTKIRQLRAGFIALAGLAMALLATPGLDELDDRGRPTPTDSGWYRFWWAVNDRVRAPIVHLIEPVQRPLRIAQSWALYPSGPARVLRLEVLVDGRPVYRSNDPDATWLASLLRYRRVRPIVAATCTRRSRNDEQLVAFIVAEARRDFPSASEIVVRCVATPWPPSDEPPAPRVSYRASAPDFRVVP